MLQIDHRESHDIDIFVDDPQILPFLNPLIQEWEVHTLPTDYITDGSRSLKLVFKDVGEIDFIACASMLKESFQLSEILGKQVCLETPEEIVCKKIYYRGATIQPRDMFDIAAVMQSQGKETLVTALSRYKSSVEAALDATARIKPDAAEKLMQRLMIRDHLRDLPRVARDMTHELLTDVLAKVS